jgi:hypothetical protein
VGFPQQLPYLFLALFAQAGEGGLKFGYLFFGFGNCGLDRFDDRVGVPSYSSGRTARPRRLRVADRILGIAFRTGQHTTGF